MLFEKIDRQKSFEIALFAHVKAVLKHSDLSIRDSVEDFLTEYNYPVDGRFERICYNLFHRMSERARVTYDTNSDVVFYVDTNSNCEAYRKIKRGFRL